MAFKLSVYPWIHQARFNGKTWEEEYIEQAHHTLEKERAMSDEEYTALVDSRNSLPHLPLVNYSTQYGLSCFEGLKAFPQPDGSLKMFRPDRNCARMAASMKGLRMPPIDEKLLLNAMKETVRRNAAIGFTPKYNPVWEKDFWQNGDAVYIRPFSYSEGGIGINLSYLPWVITICTTVSQYFTPGTNDAVTSKRTRATHNGIGQIKASANYVTSILAKAEAIDDGYIEAIFLDAANRHYIEEGSSSNFFALFPGDRLVTPAIGDTILPGVTRESIIVIAREVGLDMIEGDVLLDDVLSDAVECFVTGTAAGVTPLSSLTHLGRKQEFSSLEENSVAMHFLKELKGIQYGAVRDKYDWMLEV